MTRKSKVLVALVLILSLVFPLIVFGAAKYYMKTSPLTTWDEDPIHPELESQLLSQGYFVAHKAMVVMQTDGGSDYRLDLYYSDFARTNPAPIYGNSQVYSYQRIGDSNSTNNWYAGECGQLPYDADCYDWKFIYQGGFPSAQTDGDRDHPVLFNMQNNPLFGLEIFQTGDGGQSYSLVLPVKNNGSYTTCVEVMAKFIGRPPGATQVSTTTVDTDSGAWTGSISDTGKPGMTEAGFVYSTNPNPATLIRGTAAEVNIAKVDIGTFSVQADGLLPGVTYYVRSYGTNKVGTGYGPVTPFTLNLSPTITKTAPAASTYIGAGNITYNYTLFDREGANLINTLTITDSSGATVFTGSPNTVNTNTRATHVLNPAGLALTWSAANNRYETTLTAKLTASDGVWSPVDTSTITVYNNKPQFTLTTAMSALNVNNSEGFSFTGKTWDADQGKVTVTATVSGATAQNVVSGVPTTVPGADNFTLQYSALPTGSYTGITITATDDYGGVSSLNWTGTLNVTDVLQMILDKMKVLDYKDTDLYFIAGNTSIPISKTAGNDATVSKIETKKADLDAELIMIGQSGSQGYLQGNPADGYIVSDADRTNNLVDYLGGVLTQYGLNNSGVFNTGDFITSSIKFLDTENDYQDITNTQKIIKYDTLEDVYKKWKTGSLKLFYNHDPSIFDNPVSKHAADTNGTFVSVSGPTDSAFLSAATDSMAGLWTMKLAASDWTNTGGKHDKESDPYEMTFICNRIPHALMDINEDANNYYIDGSKSYDLDKQYSLPDNGIVTFDWYYQLPDGTWHKSSTTSNTLILSKSLQPVRYGLTVYDNYGAKDSTLDDVNMNLTANLAVDKPYPQVLKYGESFVATFTVTTSETISSVTSWVDSWGASGPMTLKSHVGNVYTYTRTYTVPNGIEDTMYKVYANVKTTQGSDETRFTKINVLNNLPPTLNYQSVLSSDGRGLMYEGDNLELFYMADDPNKDILTVVHTIYKDGVFLKTVTDTVSPSGGTYTQQISTIINDCEDGNYVINGVVSDPNGLMDSDSISFAVRPLDISGVLNPNPVRAGYWVLITATTDGYAEGVTATVSTGHHAGQSTGMIPLSAAGSLNNTWTAKYHTWDFEPDGTIPIILTARRGTHTASVTVNLVISGAMIEDNKATIKE